MTNDELHTLKALAEAATPGPWEAGNDIGEGEVYGVDGYAVVGAAAQAWTRREVDANARFIAAANPQTVLALVAEVERLREEAQLSYQRAFEAGAAQLSRSLKEIGRL